MVMAFAVVVVVVLVTAFVQVAVVSGSILFNLFLGGGICGVSSGGYWWK